MSLIVSYFIVVIQCLNSRRIRTPQWRLFDYDCDSCDFLRGVDDDCCSISHRDLVDWVQFFVRLAKMRSEYRLTGVHVSRDHGFQMMHRFHGRCCGAVDRLHLMPRGQLLLRHCYWQLSRT